MTNSAPAVERLPRAGAPAADPASPQRLDERGRFSWADRLAASPVGVATGLWLVVLVVALACRPLLPIDETRYLSVAWDMWNTGTWLVPSLNGEPYAHKGPVLFWFIDAGWWLIGVNEWTARLTAPLFGLLSVLMTARLARLLWPDEPHVRAAAPLILVGGMFWSVFTSLTYVDALLTFFVLTAVVAFIDIGRGRLALGWACASAAIGLGILTKGPVMLLHLLPVAIALPLVDRRMAVRTGSWYGLIIASFAAGGAIAAAWAIPAARAGGDAFSHAIWFSQAADRVVNSFAHPRPFWWYALILPMVLLPWAGWPPLMRIVGSAIRLGVLRRSTSSDEDRGLAAIGRETGTALCLIWIGAVIASLSLVSGKLPHYLLPILPACSLLMARVLPLCDLRRGRWDLLPLASLFIAAGIAAVILGLIGIAPLPQWLHRVAIPGGVVLASAGGALALLRPRTPSQVVIGVAVIMSALVSAMHLAAAPGIREAYDLRPVAEMIGRSQRSGAPVGYLGLYHGEYNFLARLQPLPIIDPERFDEWVIAHPAGVIAGSYSGRPWHDIGWPMFRRIFRGKSTVALWSSDEERYRALRKPPECPDLTPSQYRDLRRSVLGTGTDDHRP